MRALRILLLLKNIKLKKQYTNFIIDYYVIVRKLYRNYLIKTDSRKQVKLISYQGYYVDGALKLK